MAFEADYVYTQGRNEKDIIDNVNLRYNPATGANYPVRRRQPRPFPDWGSISLLVRTGRSAYHGLQTSFTKRLSNRWQASATYTLSGLWDAESRAFHWGPCQQPVHPGSVRDGAGPGWGVGALDRADQRHRVRCSTASGKSAAASR